MFFEITNVYHSCKLIANQFVLILLSSIFSTSDNRGRFLGLKQKGFVLIYGRLVLFTYILNVVRL